MVSKLNTHFSKINDKVVKCPLIENILILGTKVTLQSTDEQLDVVLHLSVKRRK